jgi:hypothetical protein
VPHRGTVAVTVLGLAIWLGATLGAEPLVPPIRAAVDRIGLWLKLDVARPSADGEGDDR